MKFSTYRAPILTCFIATGSWANAAEPPQERPEIFNQLVACRSVNDDARRLACYDAQVSAIDTAEARKDVVVVDKTQIKKAKKTLFGLSLPNLAIFDDDKASGEADVREIESTIKSASPVSGRDRWIIVLEDGARWMQTESKALAREPRPGMPIRIRKAAMGSFMANVDGQTAIRVRRQN